MKIEEVKKDMEKGDFLYKGPCHDCSKQVEVTATLREDGAIVIDGNGSVYKIKMGMDDRYFYKCDSCFKKDKTLRNFRDCLVYSRVVGYLRPVSGWNKGKLAEWDARKEFVNTKEKKNEKEDGI
jgi:predicted nucleic acid-binding Zn ribbon protein